MIPIILLPDLFIFLGRESKHTKIKWFAQGHS